MWVFLWSLLPQFCPLQKVPREPNTCFWDDNCSAVLLVGFEMEQKMEEEIMIQDQDYYPQ